jgi:hypothetical protein
MATLLDNSLDGSKDAEQPVIEQQRIENSVASLLLEHEEFLIRTHGTTQLDPVPSMDPKDPLNLPLWKVCFRRGGGSHDANQTLEKCGSNSHVLSWHVYYNECRWRRAINWNLGDGL